MHRCTRDQRALLREDTYAHVQTIESLNTSLSRWFWFQDKDNQFIGLEGRACLMDETVNEIGTRFWVNKMDTLEFEKNIILV